MDVAQYAGCWGPCVAYYRQYAGRTLRCAAEPASVLHVGRVFETVLEALIIVGLGFFRPRCALEM